MSLYGQKRKWGLDENIIISGVGLTTERWLPLEKQYHEEVTLYSHRLCWFLASQKYPEHCDLLKHWQKKCKVYSLLPLCAQIF